MKRENARTSGDVTGDLEPRGPDVSKSAASTPKQNAGVPRRPLSLSQAWIAEQFRDAGSSSRVVCADLSPASLAEARSHFVALGVAEWVDVWHVDLRTLDPVRHGAFDYVLSSGGVHHLPDPAVGLRALASVVAPGGGLGLMVYASHGWGPIAEAAALLQPIADRPWAERLAAARAAARALLPAKLPAAWAADVVGERGRDEMTVLDDDAYAADALLVPFSRASERENFGRGPRPST